MGILLLAALAFGLKLGENGALFSSAKGPGSMHAPILISLGFSIVVGALMHKSKFCSVGAFGRLFKKDFSMFTGIISIVVFASIVNLALGQYKFGFEGQPIAHNDVLWNFLSMTLAGLCFSLSEGCPGKHLVQMGTGNLSSVIFVIGMAAGAAPRRSLDAGGPARRRRGSHAADFPHLAERRGLAAADLTESVAGPACDVSGSLIRPCEHILLGGSQPAATSPSESLWIVSTTPHRLVTRYSPARHSRSVPQLSLRYKVIDLDDNAVDLVHQGMALFTVLGNIPKNIID